MRAQTPAITHYNMLMFAMCFIKMANIEARLYAFVNLNCDISSAFDTALEKVFNMSFNYCGDAQTLAWNA